MSGALTGFDRERIEVGETRPEEIPAAIGVVARAMSTSPMPRAAFGSDPQACRRHLTRLFTRLYAGAAHQRPLVARLDGRVVASTNDLVAGGCRFTPGQRLRMLPPLLAMGPPVALRTMRWFSQWERRDPDRPHSHYGPFGVEPELQGRGIGSLVMAEYTRRLDAGGEDAYLETDKPENVALYGRFGFEIVDEAEVLGRPNWFMWPESGAAGTATRGR